MQSADFKWLSDEALVTWLAARNRRPNLMVLASGLPMAAVAERLTGVCARPVTTVVFPGPLRLPRAGGGTVVLHNVSSMSVSQQIALNDWIGEARELPQIVSIADGPVWPLVLNGEFLEGLFYRLNVTCLDAAQRAPSRFRPNGSIKGMARAQETW